MVLSYSAAAKPAAQVSTTTVSASNNVLTDQASSGSSSHETGVNHLILDAGPLLSLTPLRHLAQTFHTTPLVFAELRDPKAREHWERLGLSGVDVRVEAPSAESMSKVVAFAKKTGDYAVLSQTDVSVIALTYQYEVMENGEENIRTEPGQKTPSQSLPTGIRSTGQSVPKVEGGNGKDGESEDEDDSDEEDEEEVGEGDEEDEAQAHEPDQAEVSSQSIDQVLLQSDSTTVDKDHSFSPIASSSPNSPPSTQHALPPSQPDTVDEDDESDGGEWITPTNVTSRRNHDLGLLPSDSAGGSGQGEVKHLAAACMTGDFAVQNVLLEMGLGLVGDGGKRISKVKSFVLRCHACFKICRDSSKRFCPSCGNPSLLRTTVTVNAKTGQLKIHLKKNFQYHLRGSKYTIPDAKPGRAKGQQKGGTGLILREDQAEWQNAVRYQDKKKEKEERRAAKGALDGWNDPDWLPEIITVGMSGKGRSGGQGMPAIGHGRRNPNQARQKR